MRLMLLLVSAFSSNTIWQVALGYSPPFRCPSRTFLFFANGMTNSQKKADISLRALSDDLDRYIKARNKLTWYLADREVLYNTDQSRLIELLEVFLQKEHEFRIEFWDWLWNLARAPEWFQQGFRKIFLDTFESNAIGKEDLEIQLEAAKNVIEEGFLPVVVSHSQGNLFANSLYHLLNKKEKKHFAISAVATPASRVEGSGPYVTLESDGVIVYLAKAFSPPPLPANITNNSPKPGLNDHAFIRYYLHGKPTGKRLIEQTLSQMEKLANINNADTSTAPDSECISWFQEGKAPKEKNFFDCYGQCVVGLTGMADFFCPQQCDRLCGCESYGQLVEQ